MTSAELKLKDDIHKLIKNNCEENINRTSIIQSSIKITSNNTQSINDSDKHSSINALKEQVAIIKENSTSRIKSAKLSQKKVSYRNHRRLDVKRYSRERHEQG